MLQTCVQRVCRNNGDRLKRSPNRFEDLVGGHGFLRVATPSSDLVRILRSVQANDKGTASLSVPLNRSYPVEKHADLFILTS